MNQWPMVQADRVGETGLTDRLHLSKAKWPSQGEEARATIRIFNQRPKRHEAALRTNPLLHRRNVRPAKELCGCAPVLRREIVSGSDLLKIDLPCARADFEVEGGLHGEGHLERLWREVGGSNERGEPGGPGLEQSKRGRRAGGKWCTCGCLPG